MIKEVIEIRGNITPALARYEAMAKEREEREKAERDAKWKRDCEEREAREKAWKNEHPILDKFTFMSEWNWNTYSWIGDLCNISFYEWSNIYSEPKFFPNTTAFYRFLDSSKLNLTVEQNNKIKGNVGCHITCIPGTHDLIIGTDFDSLRSQFNASKVLSTVPVLPKVIQCKVYGNNNDYA